MELMYQFNLDSHIRPYALIASGVSPSNASRSGGSHVVL